MTNQRNRKKQEMGFLKTLLVVGSVAATLAGTRLLAVKDTLAETAVSESEQVIIIETMPVTPLPMPPTSSSDQVIVLDLAPVPQAVQPQINPVQAQPVLQVQRVQPVARTKSS
jgi:hypothetical protein